MSVDDPLNAFLPAVRAWFTGTLGSPTLVQRLGWPSIAAGKHTLLLAPTGSGKTLAAFLACLDQLWRQPALTPGVRVLYISPLKALNNDIARNLLIPLEGVAAQALSQSVQLPKIEMAVRTGDTPNAERQRLVRRPPQVLITTPESLHLMLTSQARSVLQGIQYCIIDEIHALCPNKRGVFLAILLERLQALNPAGFVRIGLSATQRPLEEVARYLGGSAIDGEGNGQPRPVAIIDAGLRKHLDLQVISPVETFGAVPEASIWPALQRRLIEEIRRHRSTIVFANNRRTVERLTNQLNEMLREFLAEDAEPIQVRAHHGSVALEVRQETEQALKEGRLRAVIATASLELGIDMGSVDLVCQVESPGNVARGLQRVGRAGHLVGQQSKGRLLGKTLPDLLNQAVLAHEMMAGRVEELRVPINSLDVLAQQIIAMVAMEDWDIEVLYRLVRQAYPYRQLTPTAFDAVLQMITGRYQLAIADDPTGPAPAKSSQHLAALQARISWDRVHQRLRALPGSQRLALMHGGTIPDTGQYAVYTTTGVRLGELDEEFVYERRVGDTFLLGTSAWKLDRVETDRVIVQPVQGTPAMVPFWRGEGTGRSYDLGLAQGRFLREFIEHRDQPDCLAWLERDYCLEPTAARNVRSFIDRQLWRTECLPTDRTVFIEASRDQLGDWQVMLMTPFGRAFHLGLRLAIEQVLERRLGYRPQSLHHDDGIMIRLTDSEEPILDLFEGISPENIRELVLDELADSALFALRFRQNAARALMMPSGGAGKRSPLWLQRLRGRDLLQVARRYPDFPIVAETFRECLHDHLDIPHLEAFLQGIRSGEIEVRTARLEGPSPFAASILFAFTMASMYVYDGVESEGSTTSARLDKALLEQIVGSEKIELDPRAIQQVDQRLRGVGRPPRSKTEFAEWLRQLGDISTSQLEGAMPDYLRELIQEGVVQEFDIPGTREPKRWILTEEVERYRLVFSSTDAANPAALEAASQILQRYLNTHALVGLREVLDRYALDPTWTQRQIETWATLGRLVVVSTAHAGEPIQWSVPDNFEQMQRGTLSIHRHEVVTCPAPQWADFVVRWQHLHPTTCKNSAEGLTEVLDRLQACSLPTELWEQSILPARLADYEPRWLDDAIRSGRWIWTCPEDQLFFLAREQVSELPIPIVSEAMVRPDADRLLTALRGRGGLFAQDLAQHLQATPARIRAELWALLKQGLVTNDLYDVLRRGEPRLENEAPPLRNRGELRAFLRQSTRRTEVSWNEGRWELIGWGMPDVERLAFTRAHLLLQRYGIVARELALLDPAMPPWRILYEILSRLELAGEVRRGYFVEGLSGAQFALPHAAGLLRDLASPGIAQAPLILLASLDPANVYGSGAPLDLTLLAGGTRPFPRRLGNSLVIQAGRPLLLIEQFGKRLTALPSVGRDELAQAVRLLPDLLGRRPRQDHRHKLTVESWNEEPVTSSPGKELLESAGFVRDYQAMTLYDAWR